VPSFYALEQPRASKAQQLLKREGEGHDARLQFEKSEGRQEKVDAKEGVPGVQNDSTRTEDRRSVAGNSKILKTSLHDNGPSSCD